MKAGMRVPFGELIIGLMLAIFGGRQPAVAQSTYTAQLSGVLTDSTGGVVPAAKVILTDEGTGVATTVVTDATGIYVLTGLRPGTYTIGVEAANLATQ